ncbi:hypothetical protein QSV08_04935 [Maribacter sp. BPC-D8]|uniref:hypothetical protein n=1 Tax=Maribacter sp. BPC-D8 TaxID=3053613 RepID=UPI002B4A022E|nr:hypothetical protein [Maribacter sp. BPC-D8]WRI30587.1 hypothetical protein QSV08_04935 [Maribacter sp. BPC-D8]
MPILNRFLGVIITCVTTVMCLNPIDLIAQESGINIDFNLGTNPTSPLREFHKSLKNQVNFENFDTTDNFSYNYGFTVGVTIKKIKSSIFYANLVSGAKTSVADYSGYLRLTNELNGHTIGYKYFLPLKETPKGNFIAQFKGLVTFSSFDVISDSDIVGVSVFESLEFKSTDLGLGAGILYEYPLSFIILRAYVDLDVYYGGKMKLKEDNPDGGFLLNDNGDKLTTGWGGLSAGVGITIPM